MAADRRDPVRDHRVPPAAVRLSNLFENLFLSVLIVRRFAPRLEPRTGPQLALVLAVLLIPKLVQEYVLHVEELHPWQWLRDTFVRPILGDQALAVSRGAG